MFLVEGNVRGKEYFIFCIINLCIEFDFISWRIYDID